MTQANDTLLVFSSFPDQQTALDVADTLVAENLAACVQVSAPMTSIYRWQGEICRESEVALQLKCHRRVYPELAHRLVELHPYDIPELLAVAATEGLPAYLDWIKDNTK